MNSNKSFVRELLGDLPEICQNIFGHLENFGRNPANWSWALLKNCSIPAIFWELWITKCLHRALMVLAPKRIRMVEISFVSPIESFFGGQNVTLHLKKIFLACAAYVSTEKQVVLLTLFVHQTWILSNLVCVARHHTPHALHLIKMDSSGEVSISIYCYLLQCWNSSVETDA